ncbi:MAG: hypothetical protein NDI61_05285 [Bdellovibrionaceae bacterium]|nr:hypothetical protein [Pseudobdellovibrionaceae bacterium]
MRLFIWPQRRNSVVVFVIALLCPLFEIQAQTRIKWAEGEHLELGATGARRACKEFGLTNEQCPVRGIRRSDRAIAFTYGELLAAADYYPTPDELDADSKLGIQKVIRCSHRLLRDHPSHRPDQEKYPDCNMTGFFRIPGFLEVVSKNYDHFGWHNMKAYVRYHTRALEKARQAFQTKSTSPKESRRALEQALILNAFADHYLTDAFPSGHIRLPRTQLKAWAKRNLKGALPALRGDLLAIVLHENESRDLRTKQERGFRVRNSRGDVWLTRGDQYLHVNANPLDPTYLMPLLAVTESFREILAAWQWGETPDGIFSATKYVPFHAELPLAEKFSPAHQQMPAHEIFDALYSALPFYQRLLTPKSDLKRMFSHLPEIFARFRRDVRQDLRSDTNLELRLPDAYLDASLTID